MIPVDPDRLRFTPITPELPPLVAVIAQDALNGEVLMMAWADPTALERTAAEERLWLFSRSRRRLWLKGESSGNELRVVSLTPDCDGDAVLARVRATGPACHTGARACFDARPTLRALADVIAQRLAAIGGSDDHDSYTARLARDRNLRLKKLGEEAVELALACDCRDWPDPARVAAEAADLVYHALVACTVAGVTTDDVLAELESRLERPRLDARRAPGAGGR